jgi:hypothetical protein
MVRSIDWSAFSQLGDPSRDGGTAPLNAGSVEQMNLAGKLTAEASQSSEPGGATVSGQPAGRYTSGMGAP